jgi:hypothetical protein
LLALSYLLQVVWQKDCWFAGIYRLAFGHVGSMGKVSDQEDTSCLALDIYQQVFYLLVARVFYIQAFVQVDTSLVRIGLVDNLDPLVGRQPLVFLVRHVELYRKLLLL